MGFNRNVIPPPLNPNNTQPDSCVGTMDEQLLNMLKIIFHDLRSSLLSILAYLKLLDRGYYGKMDEDVKIKLEELVGKTKSLIGMTEESLGRAFSINEGLEIEREIMDLRQDIINPILEEFSHEIRDRQIHIDNRLDAISKHPIPMWGSKVWMKAVFRNLLKNAIKYGDKGSTITLGFEDHGSYFRLNVFNSGKPIPEEYREKLFTRFVCFENNDNGNGMGDGMGLGLYLIKKIIQKHGGDIWYEPKENGSNFVFTLPGN